MANLLVEVARQHGEQWPERLLCHPNKVQDFADKHKSNAIFSTTFAIQTELKPEDIHDIGKLFETAPKQGDLYFDFDHKDLSLAQEDAYLVIKHLTEHLKVPQEAIKVYLSGSKGFHVMVAWSATGLQPRPDLHTIYRRLATSLAKYTCKNNTLDTKIYNSRRLWRYPGSIHQKTTKAKIQIPISCMSVPLSGRDLPVLEEKDWSNLQTASLLHNALTSIETMQLERQDQLKKLPSEFLLEPLDCIKHVLEEGIPEGNRNDAAYTTALYFRACGLSEESTKARLTASALFSGAGMDERELKTTVASAYKSGHSFGLRDNVLGDLITERDQARWTSARVEEDYEPYQEVVRQYLLELDNPHRKVARYHVPALDRRMGGIVSGELVVLGGTTGTGKSEFAFHVAFENAKTGTPSAFITLEVDNQHFIARQIRSLTGLDGAKVFDGDSSMEEAAAIKEAATSLQNLDIPLFFRKRKSLMTVEDLEKMVQSLIVEQQVRLVVIDHLHYLAHNKKYESENQNIAAAIRGINSIAVRYGVGVICVAHFRKQQDPLHRPSLHEFRDSSAIEQEASTVLILWRNVAGLTEQAQCETEFAIAKSRKDILLGTVVTTFDRSTRQYI